MRQGESCRTLQELFRMALVNFLTIVVLKILDNLFSMQNSLNANNSDLSEIAQRDLIFILSVLSESSIHFG